MARPYATEMARIGQTFDWAAAADIQPLRQAVQDRPAYLPCVPSALADPLRPLMHWQASISGSQGELQLLSPPSKLRTD
jgi:hypothetical protein